MKGNAFLALIGGVAIGATLGILFAPSKGSKTRKRIMEKGVDYIDGVKDQIGSLLDSITSKSQATEKETEKLVEKEFNTMEKNAAY